MKRNLLVICLLMTSVVGYSQNNVKDKFLAMLNGTEAAAEKAVKTHCSAEIIENGMLPMGGNMVITSKEGDCYFFTLIEDDEENRYFICSEGDKIVEFEWDLDSYDEEDDDE